MWVGLGAVALFVLVFLVVFGLKLMNWMTNMMLKTVYILIKLGLIVFAAGCLAAVVFLFTWDWQVAVAIFLVCIALVAILKVMK